MSDDSCEKYKYMLKGGEILPERKAFSEEFESDDFKLVTRS